MANRLWGFARMLSTAKNSARKEGFRRMVSSSAENYPKGDYFKERMKQIYGDIYYRTLTSAQKDKMVQRHVNRELNMVFFKALSPVAVVGIGLAINFAFGLHPFHQKGILGRDEDDDSALQLEPAAEEVLAMLYKY